MHHYNHIYKTLRITFLFLGLSITSLYAQQYLFNTLGVEDGLSQSNVEDIVQDKYGYLWVATQHGLNRYDGYKFKNYVYIPGDTNSFKYPFARTLFVDRDGDIISAMRKDVIVFDYKNEVFRYYENESVTIESDEIEASEIYQDKQGFIWFGFNMSEFWVFNKKTKSFFNHGIKDTLGYTFYFSNHFCIDDNNNLWLAAEKNKEKYSVCLNLDSLHNSGKHIYRFYPLKKRNNENLYGYGRYFFNSQGLLMSFSKQEIFSFNFEENKWEYIPNNLVTQIEINGLVWDGSKYWATEDAKGIYLLDSDFKLIHFIKPQDGEKSIPNHRFKSVFLDNTGVMWLGTFNGVSSIDVHRKNFFELRDKEKNAANYEIVSLALNHNNELWVSSSNGISIYNSDLSVKEKHTENKNYQHLKLNSLLSMYPYKNGIMFLSGAGIQKISFDEDIYQYQHPNELNNETGYGFWTTWSIYQGKVTGVYWFCTSQGLSYLVKDKYPTGVVGKQGKMPEKFMTYRQYDGDKKRFASPNIWCAHESHDSILWVGSIEGLTRFDLKTGEFKILNHTPGDPDAISHPKIKCIYEDSKNRIWIGTEGGGLNLLNHAGEKIKVYNIITGLCSDIVWGILEDESGNLWISTTKGLSKFNPEAESFVNFYKSHGLPGTEFLRGMYAKADDGRMFFGTKNGVTVFHPDSIKTNTIAPKILISAIYLFNEEVKVGQEINGDVILSSTILNAKELEFSHKNNVITIEFTGIHFPSPEHISYQYTLEGFDTKWNSTTSDNRRAHYTNLPAGRYKFRVKAANYDGVWSNDEASVILMKIKPPFWETWVFRIIVLLLLTFLVYLVYKIRVRALHNRQAELEVQVLERTQEINEKNEELLVQADNLQELNTQLEERQEEVVAQNEEIKAQTRELQKLNSTKDKFFSIIAHDLKNPFHAINGFSSLLKRSYDVIEDDKKREFISMIEQSSKSASALLENLLTWSRTQTNRVKFEPKMVVLNEIVDETLNLLKVNAQQKKIALSSNLTDNTMAYCDPNMLTTVIRNLVNNAIKFTPENGEITISAETKDLYLELSISDTGVGMSQAVIDKLFSIDQQLSTKGTSGEGGTGLGLIISYEFVHTNGGEIAVQSTEGKGSTFVISIPLKAK